MGSLGPAALALVCLFNLPPGAAGSPGVARVEPEGPRDALERQHRAVDERRRGGWWVAGGAGVLVGSASLIGATIFMGIRAHRATDPGARTGLALGATATALAGLSTVGGGVAMIDSGLVMRRQAARDLTILPTFNVSYGAAELGVLLQF